MLASLRSERWWIAANLAGLAVFLVLASRTWIEPQLRHEAVARSGDLLFGALVVLPVLVAFFVIDIIWLTRVILHGVRSRAWGAMPAVVTVALLWAVAFELNRLLF